jgi:aspartokinase
VEGTRVLKFGGTSLATPDLLRAAAARVAAIRRTGVPVAVVVSAMGHATDELVTLATQVAGPRPTPRELDVLLATGEQASAALMAMALRILAVDAVSVVGSRIGIVADSRHGHATIRRVDASEVLGALDRGTVPVIAGFQAVDAHGDLVTLGRGGSDTTAVAMAAAIRDHERPGQIARCEIFTDVDGIFAADPRAFPAATPIETISASAMLQLARAGAQVMHSPAVALALAANVEITVSRAHPGPEPGHGTRIVASVTEESGPVAVGVLVDRHRIRLHSRQPFGRVLDDTRTELGRCGITSLLDRSSGGLIVAAQDAAQSTEILRGLAGNATILVESDWTLVSLVGLEPERCGGIDVEPPTGWWDGTPATAWWLVRSPEAFAFGQRLLDGIAATASPQGDPAQRNGDYETLGREEGALAEPAAARAATITP